MNSKQLWSRALWQALGTTAYIGLISIIMNNGNRIFGETDTWVSPIAFLLLFVFSALVTSSLVLGKSIMLYLDGSKKESVMLLTYTGAILFILMLLSFLTMYLMK